MKLNASAIADRSICLHQAHTRMRRIEILAAHDPRKTQPCSPPRRDSTGSRPAHSLHASAPGQNAHSPIAQHDRVQLTTSWPDQIWPPHPAQREEEDQPDSGQSHKALPANIVPAELKPQSSILPSYWCPTGNKSSLEESILHRDRTSRHQLERSTSFSFRGRLDNFSVRPMKPGSNGVGFEKLKPLRDVHDIQPKAARDLIPLLPRANQKYRAAIPFLLRFWKRIIDIDPNVRQRLRVGTPACSRSKHLRLAISRS